MSGERAVNEDQADVAGGLPSERVATSKTLRDTAIHNVGLQLLLRNSARMENGPGRCGNTGTEAYHAPPTHEIEGEVPNILPSTLAGLTESERRVHLIHLLDDARELYDLARAGRRRLMVFARDSGVSCRDIGIVLGISEQSARDQIERAKGQGAQR